MSDDTKKPEQELTDAELEQVKGGPAFMKLGDIKGEATDANHGKWIDVLSVDNTRSR